MSLSNLPLGRINNPKSPKEQSEAIIESFRIIAKEIEENKKAIKKLQAKLKEK